jgi:hypothetical protein
MTGDSVRSRWPVELLVVIDGETVKKIVEFGADVFATIDGFRFLQDDEIEYRAGL